MGKPLGLGRTFIDNGVAALRGSVAEARTYAFDTTTRHDDGSTTRVLRHPLGVAAVVTPWNFPVLNVLIAIGPLLAAGNTVMLKPSERSPLSTARLVELLTLPDGVPDLVHGDGRAGGPWPGTRASGWSGSPGRSRPVGTATSPPSSSPRSALPPPATPRATAATRRRCSARWSTGAGATSSTGT